MSRESDDGFVCVFCDTVVFKGMCACPEETLQEIDQLDALLKQFYAHLSHKPSLTATSTSVPSTAEEN